MKLYTFPPAPNPRRLATYLGEKRLKIPVQLLSLLKGENRTPEMLAKNPMGGLPFLELDDGTIRTDSLAIREYLEELHPEPPMIGRSPVERALTRRLDRICELGVASRVARIVHNTNSPLPSVQGNPVIAEHTRAELPRVLEILDREVGEKPFLAGDHPTIADCTLFGAWEFGRAFGFEFDPERKNLHRWHRAFAERPSTRWDPDAHEA
ncbi:MAG: glutathione S-transferase family protein [Myxococcota bacterium]